MDESLKQELAELKLQAALIDLDGAWDQEREKFLVWSVDGSTEPSLDRAILILVSSGLFILGIVTITLLMPMGVVPLWLPLCVAFLGGGLGIWQGLDEAHQAKVYQNAFETYSLRRADLLAQSSVK
jgi:hypothetical protein